MMPPNHYITDCLPDSVQQLYLHFQQKEIGPIISVQSHSHVQTEQHHKRREEAEEFTQWKVDNHEICRRRAHIAWLCEKRHAWENVAMSTVLNKNIITQTSKGFVNQIFALAGDSDTAGVESFANTSHNL